MYQTVKNPVIDKIKIMGKQYDVSIFGPNGVDTVEGLSSQPDLYIKYRSDLPPANVDEVLLHEAVHMISDSLDLDLVETQVVGLGNGLYQLLMDNPKLIKLITGNKNDNM